MAHIEATYILRYPAPRNTFGGTSQLEVTFRSRFAYYLATNMPTDSYRDRGSYIATQYRDGRAIRDSLISEIDTEHDRSKERFVLHHRTNGNPVPVWAAVEVISFGTVSKVYRLLDNHTVRTAVSKSFGLPNPRLTASVIRSFVVQRNICAHHARIWNRVPDVPPPVLNKLKTGDPQIYQTATPWSRFVMLAHLVDTIRKDDGYSSHLWSHLSSQPTLVSGYQYPRHS